MKKLILAASAVMLMAGTANAERYVMVTHGEGKDPFWPVVEKAGADAAAQMGVDFEYIFNPSGDLADMAFNSGCCSNSARWDGGIITRSRLTR